MARTDPSRKRAPDGWDLVEDLVAIDGRLGGTAGERRAAELTRDRLDDAGARSPRLDEFDVQGWRRGESSIRRSDGGTVRGCIALPYSPGGTVRGELVDLGYGLPAAFEEADLEGRIAMVSSDAPGYAPFVHRRQKYDLAVEGGAAGFVYRNHLPGCLPRTGSVQGRDRPIGGIPAVGVSHETGLRLSREAGGEEIGLDVDVETPAATSANVYADVGPDTDRRLVLSCHLDAHDVSEGALDNAVGVGLVVAVAEALRDREDELETGVRIAGYGAEEYGLVGSAYHAESVDLDTIGGVVQLDGAGRSRNLKAFTHGLDGLGAVVGDVCERHLHPPSTTPEYYLSSDHWRFVERGVPGLLVHGESGGRARNRILTPADTLDKLDPRDFEYHAAILTDLLIALADADRTLPRRDPEDVSRAVAEQGQSVLADVYERTAAIQPAIE